MIFVLRIIMYWLKWWCFKVEVEYRFVNGEEVLEIRNCLFLVKRVIVSIKIVGINILNLYNK